MKNKVKKPRITCILLSLLILLTFMVNMMQVALAAPELAGSSYIIDVNDYAGSVLATGRGYTYNTSTNTLIFDATAAGNHYTITRTRPVGGMVFGIEFLPGGSPASVSIVGIDNLSRGIAIPLDFTADLSFSRYSGVDVDLRNTALTLPEGYKGTLDIRGLKAAALNFPSDYDIPIVFNGLTISGELNYPANYNLPLTIGGLFIVPANQQFPEGFSGQVIIGDANGTFEYRHDICRPGTTVSPFCNGIFLPDNISEITIMNAKTTTTGLLNILLGAVDVATADNPDGLTLILGGYSDINGYIEVADGKTLTITSVAGAGSRTGELKITSASANNATIGGNPFADSGRIFIKGGTVDATQTASSGYPAAIGGGPNKAGNVMISGGKVIARGNRDGAAIGGGAGKTGIGNVTITGGTVEATAGNNGAGIGGGSGATGGLATPAIPNPTGANVLITGGTVIATGGDLHNILLGSTGANGAGIGSGSNGFANVEITGGHVTANSGHGAGIGSGAGTGGAVVNSGNIIITGATTVIRGYAQTGSNIGAGERNGYHPTYRIDKEVDIMMYGRVPNFYSPGNISCAGNNQGDGYFVSAYTIEQRIMGDIHVFDANTKTLVKVLPIKRDEAVYMSFLFSTGHDYPEQFHIYTDYINDSGVYEGMRKYVHHYDHLPPLPGGGSSIHQLNHAIIPSVTDMKSYPHNFEGTLNNGLVVCFGKGNGTGIDVYYRVTEKYVDFDGALLFSREVSILRDDTYHGDPGSNDISGYTYKGYKWDSFQAGVFTPGNPPGRIITKNEVIYYVYKAESGVTSVTVSKTVTGRFANKSMEFTFTAYLRDENGQPMTGNIAFTGGTITGMGANAPADGVLTLDDYGKSAFTLKHGQTITILDVPANAQIRIVETTNVDYDPSFKDSAGASGTTNDTDFRVAGVNGTTDRRFDFFNAQKVEIVPTGIADDTSWTAALLMIAASLLLSGPIIIGFLQKGKQGNKNRPKMYHQAT